jgi:superfamily I DNA/RNA helicase
MLNDKITLSPEQAAIVLQFQDGNPSVSFGIDAKAGSGKTFTIIYGLNLAAPLNGCYLVFNKKNQLEAATKISNPKIAVRTLHSLGYSLIDSHWKGIKADGFTEYNRVKQVFPEAPAQFLFQTSRLVSYLKNTVITPTADDCKKAIEIKGFECVQKHQAAGWDNAKMIDAALKVFEISCEFPKDKKISFDDMVWLPVKMGWIKKQFDLICIDEAQDCNLLQFSIVMGSLLDGGRIVYVGDPNQCIYGFRGALHSGMDEFKSQLNATVYPLSVSRRCPKKVIELAQSIVPGIRAMDEAPEGKVEGIASEKMLEIVRPGTSAILSRTNAPLMKTCLSLIKRKIPAYVEGRDVGTMLKKLVENLESDTVTGFLDKLQQWQDAQIAKATGPNANAQIDLATDKADTLRAIAENAINFSDIAATIDRIFLDKDFVRVPSVVCSTVHKAKGLEWNNVYLLSDSFKSRRSATPEEITEESNIRYVAITRSKLNLYQVAGGV